MGIKLGSITELATGLLGSHKIPYTTGAITRLLRLDTLADWVVQTASSFVPSDTGAISRPVQAKLRDYVSSEDFVLTANYTTERKTRTGRIGFGNLDLSGGTGALKISDGVAPAVADHDALLFLTFTSGQSGMTIDSYGQEAVFLVRAAAGTATIPTALIANEMMANFAARGYHSGGAFTTLSRVGMQFFASEAWTSSAQGTFINWYVTAAGASSSTSRMTLHSDGTLVLGLSGSAPLTKDASGAVLQVTGIGEFIGSVYVTETDLPTIRLFRNSTVKSFIAIGNGTNISGSAAAGDLIIRAEQALWARTGGDAVAFHVTSVGHLLADARMSGKQGAIVTAANDLNLGADGNYFQISGNTQINRIQNASWQGGSEITLKFSGTPTVKHNQAGAGGNQPILLAGAADFVASANDTLTLIYDSTDAAWYETSRAVI